MWRWFRRRGEARRPSPLPLLPDLELLARGLADGLMAGDSPSVFRGSGVEADGVRPYVAGDDVRAVDWKVTARTGRPHVRELIEERGVEAHLVVDRSASLHRCAGGRPGRVALEVAAALAAAAERAGHGVGLLQVTDRAESHVPAARGRDQLRWILASLLTLRPSGTGTALARALAGVHGAVGARALVVVVSDFRLAPAQRPELSVALARLARRHDLLPVRIRTPGLEELPSVGMVSVVDPETGQSRTVDSSDPDVRRRLGEAAEETEGWWSALWSGLGVRPLDVDPFQPLTGQLRLALRLRAGRAA